MNKIIYKCSLHRESWIEMQPPLSAYCVSFHTTTAELHCRQRLMAYKAENVDLHLALSEKVGLRKNVRCTNYPRQFCKLSVKSEVFTK